MHGTAWSAGVHGRQACLEPAACAEPANQSQMCFTFIRLSSATAMGTRPSCLVVAVAHLSQNCADEDGDAPKPPTPRTLKRPTPHALEVGRQMATMMMWKTQCRMRRRMRQQKHKHQQQQQQQNDANNLSTYFSPVLRNCSERDPLAVRCSVPKLAKSKNRKGILPL